MQNPRLGVSDDGLIRLEIVVAVGNLASHRVAEKVGAVSEGTLRRRILLHGAARDATMFSLTRDIPISQNRAGGEA